MYDVKFFSPSVINHQIFRNDDWSGVGETPEKLFLRLTSAPPVKVRLPFLERVIDYAALAHVHAPVFNVLVIHGVLNKVKPIDPLMYVKRRHLTTFDASGNFFSLSPAAGVFASSRAHTARTVVGLVKTGEHK